MLWHYAKRGRAYGPVDAAELLQLVERGEITPTDLVWNPTFGDRWAPLSSVGDLFDSPTAPAPLPATEGAQAPPPVRGVGTTHNRDLMRMARESLRGRWGFGVGVSLLYAIIAGGVSFLPYVGVITGHIIAGPMAVGLFRVYLNLARRSSARVGQLFCGFKRFGTTLGAYVLLTLFVILWSLLLIIPGIIAGYSYAMTYFVIADDPTVGPLQAIARSKDMMRGKKWKLLCLSCRFVGWSLLCLLTCGIGFLWLAPFFQTALAHFYDDVRPQGCLRAP